MTHTALLVSARLHLEFERDKPIARVLLVREVEQGVPALLGGAAVAVRQTRRSRRSRRAGGWVWGLWRRRWRLPDPVGASVLAQRCSVARATAAVGRSSARPAGELAAAAGEESGRNRSGIADAMRRGSIFASARRLESWSWCWGAFHREA